MLCRPALATTPPIGLFAPSVRRLRRAMLIIALLMPVAAHALVCGDGLPDLGEECDLGAANGAPDSCCTSDCHLRASGEVCRAAAGACDAAETCDGLVPTCPPDPFQPLTGSGSIPP